MLISRKKQTGFTIVELLIVIVVISVLAGIVVVAFNGVRDRALTAGLQAELRNASSALQTYKVLNNNQYPALLSDAGIETTGEDVEFEYSYDNTTNPPTFCVTAAVDTLALNINNESSINDGACEGHADPSADTSFPSEEIANFLASDADSTDYFGVSVDVSGDTAVAGAYGNDDSGTNSGSAYIFTRSGSTWTEQAKLTASDAAAGDYFGYIVSISGDTAIVGAYNDDDDGSSSGSAYIFTRSGSTWTEQAKLTASDAAAGDYFGRAVVVSGDTAIVGAYTDDDDGSNSGSAYIFARSGSSWTEQAKLTASDAAAGDNFGFALEVSGDTAIIGAFNDDDDGSNSGSAYIFTRSGSTWTEQAKLTASDAAAGDYFGRAVSVSGDTALAGAFGDDDDGSDSGSAYIFTRSGSTWTEQAKLTASDAAAGDYFGRSLATLENVSLIGSMRSDGAGADSGAAYVFTRSGSTWTEQVKLTASDAGNGDLFGVSVALFGQRAVIGSYYDDDGGSNSGSVYVFE